jgi:hypothetical protein
MKTIKHLAFAYLAALVLLAASAFSQTTVSIATVGAVLSSNTPGVLQLPEYQCRQCGSPIIAVVVNGQFILDPIPTGFLELATPALETGDLQTGATFGQGGNLIVHCDSTCDEWYASYSATFTSAIWHKLTLANGDHYYQLMGNVTSSQGDGVFICTTDVLSGGKEWDTHMTINQCSLAVVVTGA